MKEAVLGKDRNPGTERGLREADMKREREFALFFFSFFFTNKSGSCFSSAHMCFLLLLE